MMGHRKRRFLPQRRSGATRYRFSKRLPLRRRTAAREKLAITSVVFLGFLIIVIFSARAKNEDGVSSLIDAALYTRHEFFGAQAIVPFPTAEARNRLADVLAKHPDDAEIYLKLSQLDEKLGNEELALKEMHSFVKHAPDEFKALQTMAEFLHRRAQFPAEAETLERMLRLAPAEKRLEVFSRLIKLAETHLLEKYLTPRFYEQTIKENPDAYEIVKQFQERLIDNGDNDKALTLIRQNRNQFPEHNDELIKQEASLLENMDRVKEAEEVYKKAFDPFWSSELSENFYDFLKSNDRFRAYGHELREAFRRNPADFDTALRLLDYSKYLDDARPDVFVQLEKTRAARHINWTHDELITITRLLLAEGYGEAASRFLYTLYLQGDMKPGSKLRARVLYQLFEILADAGDQRLSLTRGDLKFYQDIATADPHPGMMGGILSLILSDTDPKYEFGVEEERAVSYFNRAAAYRIFTAYKKENPTSPELAQMYLDIVRLYTADKNLDVASETLAEFEQRYTDAPEFPEVALKLADAYIATQKYDAERALYVRILDYLGQHRAKDKPLINRAETNADHTEQKQALNALSEPTTVKPSVIAYPPISNPGVNYTTVEASEGSYNNNSSYSDQFIDGDNDRASEVDYETVLQRYVSSLAKDNRTSDILALYSNEIKKYPDEQALYEQMLQWLGQTNLVDEQLRVYQEALRAFPSTTWRDRLARWYVRQRRSKEFEALSRDVIGKVDDAEAEKYLHEFIDIGGFDAQLYFALYSVAHQRFPHNLNFVNGLLKFHSEHKQWDQWRALISEYYFESRECRDQFLAHLASHNELRGYLTRARTILNQSTDSQALLPYKLFRADASAQLSDFEEAIDAYRELNRLYPNSPEFSERLINLTRSFGQHNRRFLEESAAISQSLADASPAVAAYRTRAGEVQAELGDYTKARAEWEQLIPLARGEEDTYLDTATIYWDYYQYDDALRTIHALRKQKKDETLYAFQAAVILEDKHQLRAALNEYVRALNSTGYYDDPDTYRARNRLVTLSRRPGVSNQIDAAFAEERRRNPNDKFVLDYADFLDHAKRWPEASRLLRDVVARSNSKDFLKYARSLFDDHEEVAGEVAALRRLIATTTARRFEMSYRLLLADVYSNNNQPNQAAGELRTLVQKYPTNYGVLTESADFCWRLGLRPNAVAILQSGMQRGIGRYHYQFGRKLAARYVEMQNFSAAQAVLEKLNREDRLNTEVFHELAKVYVRSGNQQQLRTTFGATIEAIKRQDLDVREIRSQVVSLRKDMIEAFTLLKDYSSAIEQHIEIINRDPDDEEQIDDAISYVRRYGGGDTLINYYQRVSREAYKNYRWNVVLARIYDAKSDFANAARQYHMALDNQPEMTELYDSLVDVYTRAKDYGSAIAALRKAQELSNDDPQYIKQLVTLLEKAGRHQEAEAERRKLPPEENKKLSVSDQFAEAARQRGTDLKVAVQKYRNAFNAFAADPFKNELKTADIVGYVQTVRSEEGLDQIMLRLWELRGRLTAEAQGKNATHAGKAKELLATLDGAIAEGVGGVAAERATGDELTALFKFIREQTAVDKDSATLALMRDLSRRAGFGSIEEEILLAFIERDYAARDWPAYQTHVRGIVDLYDERGAYQSIVTLLEAEHAREPHAVDFDFASLIATYARLLGDNARELKALRENYQKPQTQLLTSQDALIERYFEVLRASGDRSELLSCAQNSTPHQLQLIAFLLRKEDRELAHVAIESSPLPDVWKYSRNAEASLVLNEFDERSEQYFSSALNFRRIGELVKQTPDTKAQVVGDDWYQLAQKYGRWLYSTAQPEQKLKSRSFLPAMIESRPADSGEQARLGHWYLEQKDFAHAKEHLVLAHDATPDNKAILADLGSAYFLSGDSRKANELWDQIIAKSDSIADHVLYAETLIEHKLNEQARQRVTKFVTTTLQKELRGEESYDSAEEKQQFASFGNLIKTLARSFSASDSSETPLAPATEAKKARFFAQLCAAAPDNRFLPEFLIRNSIVSRHEAGPFYQILIKRSGGMPGYERDYAYSGLISESFDDSTVEYALDQETQYHRSEPDYDQIKWQREYLDYLIEQRQTEPARQLIASIEAALKWHYARPVWLCFASLRLDVRAGRVAEATAEMQRLVGIKTNPNAGETLAPSIERLNEAVALLRDEGHNEEARSLLEAAYTRELELEHFEATYFAGLARVAFERGDKALGLKGLQSLIDATKPDRNQAVAIDPATAFQLAAEMAGEFGELEAALGFRQQLLVASPDDEQNQIELVRLLSENGKSDDAIQQLADIIGNRLLTRNTRWQAVWLAPEIVAQNSSRWEKLRDRVRSVSPNDSEMKVALESLSLNSATVENDAPNAYLSSLRAIIEKRAGNNAESRNSFTRALVESRESAAWKAFAFVEDEPLEQLVALYLKENQPGAALKLAERVFQPNQNSAGQVTTSQYQTLQQRADERTRASHVNLLELLSIAAEQLGDLKRAEELEQLRFALLSKRPDRDLAQARLDHLRELRTGAQPRKLSLVIDQRLVGSG